MIIANYLSQFETAMWIGRALLAGACVGGLAFGLLLFGVTGR